MSTSIYVPRQLGVDTAVLSVGATVGQIVGGDDALDTHDGDTSYVMLARTGFLYLGGPQDFTEMTYRWERVSGPAQTASSATSVTIEGAMRRDDTADPGGAATGGQFSVEPLGLALFVWIVFSWEPDTYKDQTATLSPTTVPYFENGSAWRLTPGVIDPQFRSAFRLTYLRAVIEGGVPPLRQRNRDDNRARLKPSRQLSIRARGYL